MKISIIGAGHVGGQAASVIASAGLGDVVLLDVREGVAQGKALDIGQSLAVITGHTDIVGVEDWPETAGSDVLVITAGLARRPGMDRHDLLTANGAIVLRVVREGLRWSPDATVIIVTNPINTMAYLAFKGSGLPSTRIIGMAGMLDNARFRYFIANEIAVPLVDISSWVIGDHGEHLVPVLSQTRVGDRLLMDCVTSEQLEWILARTRNAGTEILNYLHEGSAYFAPGAAIGRMISAIVGKEETPLPCSVHLRGEYGVEDVMAGVPAILGREGIREIIEFDLSMEERRQFADAVDHIRHTNRQALHLIS